MRSHLLPAPLALTGTSPRPLPTLQPEPEAPQQWQTGTSAPLPDGSEGPGHQSADAPRVSGSPTARQVARMQDALDGLPAQTRAIFVAHCHDGFSYGTIAQRLGISVSDVMRELTLALVVLDRVNSETGP